MLPFRTNNYVIEELIDWSNVPEDPVFQLTFPQPGMLPKEWLEEVHAVRMGGGTAAEVRRAADKVRAKMNPHPAKQRSLSRISLSLSPCLSPSVSDRQAVTDTHTGG